MYKELTKEQNLVVLGSRLTFNDKDIMDLNSLLKEKNRVDFFEFLKLSIYHKTFVLCMDNIMKYGESFRIPSYLYMQYVCLFHGYDWIYKSMSPSRGQKNRAVTEHSPMVSGLDADKKEPSLRTSWEESRACVCRCRCGRRC